MRFIVRQQTAAAAQGSYPIFGEAQTPASVREPAPPRQRPAAAPFYPSTERIAASMASPSRSTIRPISDSVAMKGGASKT